MEDYEGSEIIALLPTSPFCPTAAVKAICSDTVNTTAPKNQLERREIWIPRLFLYCS